MGVVIVLSTLLSCIALGVNSMALNGTSLTRYDPCGLGVIHFDKVTTRFWQGVINIGLYTDLRNEVNIDMNFENEILLQGAIQNATAKVRENRHRLIIIPNRPTPNTFIFFIKLNDSATDVPPVMKKFSMNNVTLCDDAIKATQTVESLNVTTDPEHYAHMCGRRALEHAELTSVRTEARAGDWPWHVAIFIKDRVGNGTMYQCGGNIISRTAVLTAGHCVSNRGVMVETHRILIIAGINNYTDNKQVGKQTFIAEKVILHPSYDDIRATADLAVIKVNKFRFTDYVQPICLWGPVYDKTKLYGYQATMVGFGATENNQLSKVLRSAYTMVQNDSTCIAYDQKLYSSLLNEFTICAGFGPTVGINPRNGDSGGGLAVPTTQADHKLTWFLRGVLSKCGVAANHTECDPKFYVVYTDVGPHYGWIYHHSGLQFRANVVS